MENSCKFLDIRSIFHLMNRYLVHLANVFAVVCFTLLLVACGNSSATSVQSSTPTPTQPAVSTPTAASQPGAAFRPFTGPSFKVEYPASWQKSQTKTTAGKTVYSFVFSDQVTGFHIALHTFYVDASSPVNDLTGTQMNCNPGDTSLPPTITIHGALWYQSDMVCFLASTNYELRLLTNTNPKTKDQTTIVYGAYQQATASPPFAQANQQYFMSMLNSFQFI